MKSIKQNIKSILKFTSIFIIIFAAAFSFLNWPAVKANLNYYWQKISHRNNLNSESIKDYYLPEINNGQQFSCQDLNYQNDHIIINKLNLDVPIVWDRTEENFIQSLQYGVAHYKGTAKPGEKGNVFIAGHSSSYWWQRGPYSAIFSMIHQLELGNEVSVCYQGKVYIYKVTEKFVVKPDQVEVMYPTEEPTLTLMTCTPIGTAINRLIVRAEQIMP